MFKRFQVRRLRSSDAFFDFAAEEGKRKRMLKGQRFKYPRMPHGFFHNESVNFSLIITQTCFFSAGKMKFPTVESSYSCERIDTSELPSHRRLYSGE